jgi:N-acetylglucosamine-6-sulfatase
VTLAPSRGTKSRLRGDWLVGGDLSRRRVTGPVAAAVLAAGVALGGVYAGSATSPAAAAGQSQPNVIVVVTDDMPMLFLSGATLPTTLQLLGAEGTTFADSVVTTPLCCPSRASFLTGQYGHNNGVLSNRPGYRDLISKRSTLPMWLRRAGYATVHLGRYLNGYNQEGPKKVAPGWDEWYTALEPRNYYNYDLQVNGKTVHHGRKPSDYLTRVLNRLAVKMIRKYVPTKRPLYLQVDQFAPHDEWAHSGGYCDASATPSPGTLERFAGAPLPITPSFNEEDIADKPSFIRQLKPLDVYAIADVEREYRCRLASLVDVDRGVGKIVSALAAKGELDNTMIVFTSDNGFFHGEHRVAYEKYLPYEEAIRVPLMVRFPTSVGATSVVETPVSNIDLTATITEIAGATPCTAAGCRVLDGRSLLPLAQGGSPEWAQDRGILIELDRRFGEATRRLPCLYQGIRTSGHLFVEYTSVPGPDGLCRDSDEIEFYDLSSDPFELQNLYPATPGTAQQLVQQQLAERLATLRDCAGIEGRDPPPASGHYCD